MMETLRIIGFIIIFTGTLLGLSSARNMPTEYIIGIIVMSVISGVMFLAYATIIDHLAAIRKLLGPKAEPETATKVETADEKIKCPKCGEMNDRGRLSCIKCFAELR